MGRNVKVTKNFYFTWSRLLSTRSELPLKKGKYPPYLIVECLPLNQAIFFQIAMWGYFYEKY